MKAGIGAVLACLAGCAAGETRFGAADGGQGSSFYYELANGDRNWGDVKVWSAGVREMEDGVPILEIGFRLRADADQPIELEAAGVTAETRSDGRYERIHPDAPPASTVKAAPGAVESVSLRFRLPRNLEPEDVDEIEVNWAVRTPAGRMTFSSVFLPVVDARSYERYYGGGYYGPWYRYPGYWGYGHPHTWP